jgi:hypothetical protein
MLLNIFVSGSRVDKRVSFCLLALTTLSCLLLTSILTLLLTTVSTSVVLLSVFALCYNTIVHPNLYAISIINNITRNANNNNKSITIVFLLRGSYNSFHLLSIFLMFFLISTLRSRPVYPCVHP